MNPEAESANNEGSNVIIQAEAAINNYNNEPRGRIRPTKGSNAIIQKPPY
jgi:hypothetical protein